MSTEADMAEVGTPIGGLLRDVPVGFEPATAIVTEDGTVSENGGKTRSTWQLTAEQVSSYERDGFITNVPLLSEEDVDRLLEAVARFASPSYKPSPLWHEFHHNETQDPGAVLMHGLGHWRLDEAFHDLVWHPGAAMTTAQLLLLDPRQDLVTTAASGGKLQSVRFWHDQLFVKPAACGGNVAWHQDYSYWTRTQPMNHMTVHIALDDQTQDNGGICFVPGSHRWHRDGKPLDITSRNFADMASIQQVLTEEEAAAWRVVAGGLRRGEASFHHPLCVHGSFPNNSGVPRRAAVLNYFADGTTATTDGVLLEGQPAQRAGEPLDGNFFPRVLTVADDGQTATGNDGNSWLSMGLFAALTAALSD